MIVYFICLFVWFIMGLLYLQTILLKHKAQMYWVLHLSSNLSMPVFSALSEPWVSEGTDIQLFP